ncbi:MAG: hypothetical protein IJ209_10425 [Bacteroidaceae bacterium]|nr:hypothetical protein [Bacteroidaceae bacterium]
MNKTLTFCALSILAFASVLASCGDEDQQSYMPTWKGFTYSPQPAERGDSVKITARQNEIGHLIYRAVYNWQAKYYLSTADGADSLVTVTHTEDVVYDYDPADPTWSLYVPLGLRYSDIAVTLTAEYHYSATGPTGTDGSTIADPTAEGMMRQRQSSMFQGLSAGSLTVKVRTE